MASFKTITSEGGNGYIPLNWENNVPKYDPSSFYNWEQDNMPIWNLEDRTDTLYEALGYPGGNPEGITFTLSSAGNVDGSKGIYDSIDDIVERIPKRLKFPVLIELCTYGNLGKLDLANITCEGDGILEVRNQAYFEDVNGYAYTTANVSSSPAGAAALVNQVSSIDGSSIMMDVSATRGGVNFFNQESWNANAHIITTIGPDTDRHFNNITVHVASGNASYDNLGNGTNYGRFQLNPWNALMDRSISASTGDAMAFWGSSTASAMQETTKYTGQLYKREGAITRGQATIFGYGNWFSSVSLKDCQGTIVLRNVLTDGSTGNNDTEGDEGAAHLADYGFDIENSEVILDNTTAMFAIKSGYNAKNSRLKITGHCVGYRNYTKTSRADTARLQDGCGFQALNTDVEWDNTAYTDSRKYLNYFGKSKRGMDLRNCTVHGGISWGSDSFSPAGGSNEVSALPNAGSQQKAVAYDSPRGATLANVSGAGGDTLTTTINVANCNADGIYLEGTDFEFNGRLNTFLNVGNGLYASRSQVRVPQLTSNHNSEYGINLEGSNFQYGVKLDTMWSRPDKYTFTMYTKNATGTSSDLSKRIKNRANFHVDSNNQNVLAAKNSTCTAYKMNNIPKYFGRWGGSDWVQDSDVGAAYDYGTTVSALPATHFGATPFRIQNKPGMVATNNSTLEVVNSVYTVNSLDAGKGRVGIASNGSTIAFRGTSGCATTHNYYPVNNVERQFRSWISNGVMGTDNAVVELTGPTKSARFGVPYLVEDSSQLLIKPPTLEGTDNILDVSGYTLLNNDNNLQSSSNHTMLHVHSTRACIVANKNSGIQMYALGGKAIGNPAGNAQVDSVDVLATDYANAYLQNANNQFTMCTSGGHVKFYPNGFTSGTGALSQVSLNSVGSPLDPLKNYILPQGAHDDATTGGMCVRAVGDSYVDANLVNWHHYTLPYHISGTVYNLNGTGCLSGVDNIPDIGDSGTTVPGAGPIQDAPASPTPIGTDGNVGGGEVGEFDDYWTTGRLHDAASTNLVGAVNTDGPTAALYSPIGFGNRNPGGTNLLAGTTNPGSMACIGNETADGFRTATYAFSSNENAQNNVNLARGLSCAGSRIHIWNIADTSRIHASNCLINNADPETYCLGSDSSPTVTGANYHGPHGKWFNGVSCDYYGAGGRRTTYGSLGNSYYNAGVYRLMLSTRGDLKSYYDVSTLSGTISPGNGYGGTADTGGSFVDQVNGQGYTHWTQNVQTLANSDQLRKVATDSDFPQTIYQTSAALRVFGWGQPSNLADRGVATMGARIGGFSSYNVVSGQGGDPDKSWIYACGAPPFPLPPINMEWQGYMRNWFDQTASNVWQNAKHMSEDKVNGLSIYRSNQSGAAGGEGRDAGSTFTYGVGVRSLNLFDMDRLL